MNKELFKLLRCPETREELKLSEDELFTDTTSYPIMNSMPLLYPNIEETFLTWSSKISKFIEQEKSFLGYLSTMLKLEQSENRKKRFTKVFTAKEENLKVFENILAPFLGHEAIDLLPSTQQIHSYFNLIFRDWTWITEEIEVYTDYCKKHFTQPDLKVLILGSGAGRLSFELAKSSPNSHFYSLDHNPFLSFMAQTITSGNALDLWNIESYPKDIDKTVHKYHIQGQSLKIENHLFTLGTFPHLPFEKEAFDIIICPWFLDILDINFSDALNLVNFYLKPNGSQLFIGPSNIHKDDFYEQFTKEEIQEEYQRSFSHVKSENKTIEYLTNPNASQNRIEDVLFIKADKKKKELSPDHLDLKSKDILKWDERLQEYKSSNQLISAILSQITKDTNAFEISIIISKEFKIDQEQALYYAKNIITKIKKDLNSI